VSATGAQWELRCGGSVVSSVGMMTTTEVARPTVLGTLRLVALAALGGVLTGLASYVLLRAFDWAARTRFAHGWVVWLLPLAGLAIGFVYYRIGGRANGGTIYVVQQAHELGGGVPARTAPLILAGSTTGQLFGASVGREGVGLQMAGSITDTGGRLLRLSATDRQTLLEASLAGAFGAVFGVPFAGVVFAVQLAPRRRLVTLLVSIAAAFTGNATVHLLGYEHEQFPRLPATDWTLGLPFKLLLMGVACGLTARLFVWLVHWLKHTMAQRVLWPPARPVLGGLATIGLVALVGRDYLGLSLPLIGEAFAGADVAIWVPYLKLLFTAVALGCGFVGGEVTPLFVMGATLGAALAPTLHVPYLLLVACGFAAVFAAAASVTWAGVVMAIELFGWHAAVPAILIGVTARVFAGLPGLYIPRAPRPTLRRWTMRS